MTERPDPDSPVRVAPGAVWLDLDVPNSSDPQERAPSAESRRWILLALATSLALVATLSLAARPEAGQDAAADQISTPTTSELAGSSVSSAAPTTTRPPAETGSLDRPIHSVEHTPSGLLALPAGFPDGGELLRSERGLDWSAVGVGTQAFLDLDLADESPVLRSLQLNGDDPPTAGEFESVDGGANWSPVGSALDIGEVRGAPFGLLTDDWWAIVGRVGVDEPIAEVSEALTAMSLGDPPGLVSQSGGDIDAALMNRVCAIDSDADGRGLATYDLWNCTGALLDSVRPRSREQVRTLELAAAILDAGFVLSAGGADWTAQVEFDQGTLPQFAVAMDDRLLILAVEVLFALEGPNRSVAQGIPFHIWEWSPSDGLRRVESPATTPLWRGHRLVGLDDEVILTTPDRIYRFEPGEADRWEPFEPPTKRGEFILPSRDGRAVYTTTLGPAELLISLDLVEWEPVSVAAGAVVDVLAVIDNDVVLLTGDGTTIRVPLGRGQRSPPLTPPPPFDSTEP